jgi:hypothetical protein
MTAPKEHGPPTISVIVFVQGSLEGKHYTWTQTMKVGEAADQVAADAGFPADPTFTFQLGKEVLDRKKPLIAAGVRNGDELQLTSIGGGV